MQIRHEKGNGMLIPIDNGKTIDTERDLTPEERHVLQKLFAWKEFAKSIGEFREKKERALQVGWNNSGPVRISHNLQMIISDLEKQVVRRLKQAD